MSEFNDPTDLAKSIHEMTVQSPAVLVEHHPDVDMAILWERVEFDMHANLIDRT